MKKIFTLAVAVIVMGSVSFAQDAAKKATDKKMPAKTETKKDDKKADGKKTEKKADAKKDEKKADKK